MKKRNVWIIVGIFLLFLIGFIYSNNRAERIDTIKIGAILPLTGNAAVYGNPIKEGMELAREELAKKDVKIEIYYEDSQGDAKQAVNAYENLKLKNPDVIVSALSRASAPLIPLANRDKLPLIMTVVSAKMNQTPYVIRFYPGNTGYSDAHFLTLEKDIKKIALVNVNDEFGISLKESIIDKAKENNVSIVFEDKFEPGTKDFRTILLKLKEKNPDALMIIGATPAEIIEPLKEIKELNINVDFYEVGTALSIKSSREQVDSEGAYTTAFPFVLNKSGQEFRNNYFKRYNKEAFFAAPFGYDIVNLVYKASSGKKTSGKELMDSIYTLELFNSSNEEVKINNGEINPRLYSVKIVNGELGVVE
jgi:branched-chain amino acid transport system substrate-binding protein